MSTKPAAGHADFPDVCKSWDPTKPAPTPLKDVEDRKRSVVQLIRNITQGSPTNATFARSDLEKEFSERASEFPALEGVNCASSRDHKGDKRSLAYLIELLKADKVIQVQRNGPIKVLDISIEKMPLPPLAA